VLGTLAVQETVAVAVVLVLTAQEPQHTMLVLVVLELAQALME
jgi:hypothetical protein